jgi:Secretion system C-terminal sorting domain/HYDIN/CFA65/VesB-like, Ig-like domain
MRKILIVFISMLLISACVFAGPKTALNTGNQAGPVFMNLDEPLDVLLTLAEIDTATGVSGSISAALTSDGFVSHVWEPPYTISVFDIDGNLIHQEDPPASMGALWNEADYDPTTGLIFTINDVGRCWAFDPMDVAGTAEEIANPGTDAWSIGYDYDNQIIYWADGYSSTASGAYHLPSETAIAFDMPDSLVGDMPWGLGYMADDPEGFTIWATWTDGQTENALYKYNPTTTAWSDPIQLTAPMDSCSFSALCMTNEYRDGFIDMVALYQSTKEVDTPSNVIQILEGFATTPIETGIVMGLVTDENGAGLAGVEVKRSWGGPVISTSADDGLFGFDINVSTHAFTFTLEDYLPVTVTDVVVTADDITNIPDFTMQAAVAEPVLNPTTLDLYYDLSDAGSDVTGTITLSNIGNIPLIFTASIASDQTDITLSVSRTGGTVQIDGSLDLEITINCLESQPAGDFTATLTVDGDNCDPVTATVNMSIVNDVVESNITPDEYSLYQNYPNPFNPSTAIKFDLKAAQTVNLVVFNMLGKEVANLVNRQMNAGSHSVRFDASQLSSGIYFYRIETEAFTSMKKMVLVK